MTKDWQRQRVNLNHSWLKNEFICHLEAFLQRNEQDAQDMRKMQEFINQDWPKWKANILEIKNLIDTAEEYLSPRRLFSEPPLKNCQVQTKEWLIDLIHKLWLFRTSTAEIIEESRAAFFSSLHLFKNTNAAIEENIILSRENSQLLKQMFEKLLNDVRRLSTCLAAMPHKIKVV
ncbi:MAG: hypothetical protein SCM96_15240 [Acidobacteriota bacterium]|nr:hypothetical protein [Acidobacteriota bacterium]